MITILSRAICNNRKDLYKDLCHNDSVDPFAKVAVFTSFGEMISLPG